MTVRLEIGVLMGGSSSERDISLLTGKAVISALQDLGHFVFSIDPISGVTQTIQTLTKKKPTVVFNALHGRFGEDGTIQGLLELLKIPYTHSPVLASAIAMNKPTAKHLFRQAGIQCPEHQVATKSEILDRDILPRPYVIKPCKEGSSIGVKIISDGTTLPHSTDDLWEYGDGFMVERFIPGRELTVAVMGDKALGITELRPKSGFYDFESKYSEGKTNHIIPADLPASVSKIAMDSAVKAHKILGCKGITRSDFRYDDQQSGADGLYLLELNTQPGLTPLSLVPEQAAYAGISFHDLVEWMVESATCDY
ncbi:MAG: D-alanine--D-alanine ligase [Alphaproteobacteria bacterium]